VSWGNLCALAFSHRPGLPDRFYRRHKLDESSVIRITIDRENNDKIVGSVRIIKREIVLNNHAALHHDTSSNGASLDLLPIYGVGEVCNHPEYRGKGLSTLMLTDAMAYIDNGSSFAAISALHAALDKQALYSKYRYVATRIPYSRISLPRSSLLSPLASVSTVESIRLLAELQLEEMNQLHHEFSKDILKVQGFVRRSVSYWRSHIDNVVGGGSYCVLIDDASKKVIAQGIVMKKPEGYKLMDFAVNPDRLTRNDAVDFFTTLVVKAVSGQEAMTASDVAVSLPLKVATWLFSESSFAPVSVDDESSDIGWMYRASSPLQGNAENKSEKILEQIMSASNSSNWFTWQLDSF
jgi:predicted GNAT family N-acyltransferase